MYPFSLELSALLLSFFGISMFTIFWGKYFKVGLDQKDKIQALHDSQSFRIGGIINIIFILILVFIFGIFKKIPTFFIFFIPLIIISVYEDIFQNVSVKTRLLVIFFTAFFLIYISESYLRDINISFLNFIFSNVFISIILTSFGVLVACNAWNFIDGVNGLSSGLGAFVLFSFTIISGEIYIDGFREFLTLSAFVFLGFAICNLVTGKIFLGDTGSYFLGMLIGWAGVLIATYNDNISPWAIFLIIIYPASDITFSVFRRLYLKKSPFDSDNLHLHSLIHSMLKLKINRNSLLLNSLTGIIVLIFGILPGMLCIKVKGIYPITLYACILYFLFYIISYVLIIIILKKHHNRKFNI